jgi:hypothetical protein
VKLGVRSTAVFFRESVSVETEETAFVRHGPYQAGNQTNAQNPILLAFP